MIENFFKAVFSPTQYVYQTMPEGYSADTIFQNQPTIAQLSQQQFKNFIGSLPSGGNSKLDKKEMTFFQNVFANYAASQAPKPVPSAPLPHAFADKVPPAPDKKTENKGDGSTDIKDEGLNKEALLLERELNEAKIKEAMQTKIDSKEYLEAHQKVLELQKNLNDTLFQKQELEKQLHDLQKQIQSDNKGQVFSPTLAKEAPQQETKFVRSIPQGMAKGVGLPITPEFPNIITGIVKDPRGNPLPNILVEVKDAQDNAVRAFKTNALGQFASATPLVNGRYTIAFEDPKELNKFDSIAFEATGQIILPIEVISVDTREELRRSLFN